VPARQDRSDDVRWQAAGAFTRRIIEEGGKVTDPDLEAVRCAGYDDKQVLELVGLIAVIAQFVLTIRMNDVADTDVDFA
jgi:alkylhydroperoxidase family enzyme